jgi:hypothetical protein
MKHRLVQHISYCPPKHSIVSSEFTMVNMSCIALPVIAGIKILTPARRNCVVFPLHRTQTTVQIEDAVIRVLILRQEHSGVGNFMRSTKPPNRNTLL